MTRRLFSPTFLLTELCRALAIVALAGLAVRSAILLDPFGYDSFFYHLPFAALRGGVALPYDMNDTIRGQFNAFPPLPGDAGLAASHRLGERDRRVTSSPSPRSWLRAHRPRGVLAGVAHLADRAARANPYQRRLRRPLRQRLAGDRHRVLFAASSPSGARGQSSSVAWRASPWPPGPYISCRS